MKISTILSIACILFAGVSCSMENDVMNDVTKAGAENATAGEAAISLQAILPSAITKAATYTDGGEQAANDAEKAITKCSIILLDGAGVIKAIDGVKVDADNHVIYDDNTDVKFLVKVAKAYDLMVIANSSVAFEGTTYNTYAKIQAAVQGADDLATMVKVGKSAFTVPATYQYVSYTSNDPDMWANPYKVMVNLTQLNARIELAAFNVKSLTAGTTPQDIKITKVELVNINTVSNTYSAEHLTATDCYVGAEKTFTGGLLVRAKAIASDVASTYAFSETDKPVFYSFRNKGQVADDQVTMRIHFLLGNDKKVSKDIIINEGVVEAGYLYRILVDATVMNNDNIEISIKCFVQDWVKTSFTTEMTEK